MAQDPNDSAGGKEHTSNARPSTKAKHQAGETAKVRSRGGERGDRNREHPRRKPEGWRGGWPPIKYLMSNIVIQVGLREPSSRPMFRMALESWANQLKLVEAWKVEAGASDEGHFWNLHLQTHDLQATWDSMKYLITYFESRYRASRGRGMSIDFSQQPPTIIVASAGDSWDEYTLLHHTYPMDNGK